ncbi:hypothetical protein V5O48_002634 [Marasmius crinis-equi]|uniref:Uncharacterized protein n=1 Tax=Marasmius crinis-equi TaxID=585013 RepID=A0ABR3FV31_9AGAR
MGRPAPYLSSLHLFLAPRGLDAPLLQDISFDGDYPHLQILNIYGCDIGKLDLGSMRRLKYFRVCYPFGNILLRSLPSVTYLLRQLDYIQSSLQYLELERCWISNSTGSNLNLSFPRLRRLIISSTFAAVTSLLPYLAFPATTGVRIMSFDISDSDFHTLVAWLTQCFARSSSRGYRRIEYLYLSSKVDGLKGIMLSTWPDSNTNGERAPSQFSLRLHASVMMMGSQDSRIDNLLSVLPLADLQRLRYCFSPDESESLLQYFQTLPSLHTIEHIGAAFLEKTVRALTQDQRSGRSSIESHPPFISDTFVPFPALRHIVLESLDFSLGVQRVWQPDLWPDRFAEALLARHEHGAPLPAIVLKKCRGVDMDYIEKLRSLNISVFVEDD